MGDHSRGHLPAFQSMQRGGQDKPARWPPQCRHSRQTGVYPVLGSSPPTLRSIDQSPPASLEFLPLQLNFQPKHGPPHPDCILVQHDRASKCACFCNAPLRASNTVPAGCLQTAVVSPAHHTTPPLPPPRCHLCTPHYRLTSISSCACLCSSASFTSSLRLASALPFFLRLDAPLEPMLAAVAGSAVDHMGHEFGHLDHCWYHCRTGAGQHRRHDYRAAAQHAGMTDVQVKSLYVAMGAAGAVPVRAIAGSEAAWAVPEVM